MPFSFNLHCGSFTYYVTFIVIGWTHTRDFHVWFQPSEQLMYQKPAWAAALDLTTHPSFDLIVLVWSYSTPQVNVPALLAMHMTICPTTIPSQYSHWALYSHARSRYIYCLVRAAQSNKNKNDVQITSSKSCGCYSHPGKKKTRRSG